MARKNIDIADAARATGRPVIKLPEATVARFVKNSRNVWEALYTWLEENGHAPGVERRDMHNVTRVGSLTMRRLLAAERSRLSTTVRIANVDGKLQRVPASSRQGRRPTAQELNQMLSWGNLGSGPREDDDAGHRLKGDGLYVILVEQA